LHLVRFLDDEETVRLGRDLGDGQAELLSPEDPLAGQWEPTGQPRPLVHRLAPVEPTNIYCIGLNYRRHAAETGQQLPDRPVVFMKPTSTLQHPGGAIRLPRCQLAGPEVDYEAELAVVIGRGGRDIPEARAMEHVRGYTAANDVSARRWQKQAGGGQWIRGKSFDTFCPLGPSLLTPASLPDPHDLTIAAYRNGEALQQSHTSDMIFTVAQLVAFLSQDTTLLPGTVILTGTPEGVGFVRQPPVFLEPGDEITIELASVGQLTNPVRQGETADEPQM
jgi:2-keto-4-pentenoate hydratase/2-oxohepta-3-ene-1,7-dioic acid hydratase in catechol pathway